MKMIYTASRIPHQLKEMFSARYYHLKMKDQFYSVNLKCLFSNCNSLFRLMNSLYNAAAKMNLVTTVRNAAVNVLVISQNVGLEINVGNFMESARSQRIKYVSIVQIALVIAVVRLKERKESAKLHSGALSEEVPVIKNQSRVSSFMSSKMQFFF